MHETVTANASHDQREEVSSKWGDHQGTAQKKGDGASRFKLAATHGKRLAGAFDWQAVVNVSVFMLIQPSPAARRHQRYQRTPSRAIGLTVILKIS